MWVARQYLGLTMPFLEWAYIGWRLVVVTWEELGPGFGNGWVVMLGLSFVVEDQNAILG